MWVLEILVLRNSGIFCYGRIRKASSQMAEEAHKDKHIFFLKLMMESNLLNALLCHSRQKSSTQCIHYFSWVFLFSKYMIYYSTNTAIYRAKKR